MAKKDAGKEFSEIPEEKIKKKVKADARTKKITQAVATLKEEFGIDVEPVKNSKYKIERVINFLNEKYDFKYNMINTDTEYKSKTEKEFKYFDDRDYRDVFLDLKLHNLPLPDQDFKAIVYGSSVSQAFDPFKEYLKNLPVWDGKRDYIREFLQQVYLKDENKDRQYFVEGFKKWFVALVVSLWIDIPDRRFINQTCLVLVGGQGKYKSTFLKSIVPAHLQLKYFYGSSFQVHNKDHEKYMAYKILIDLDEMAAMNKTDIESVKSKLSQDQIVIRLPYGKADVHLKRRASFCGSINNTEFLRDETGSRRWFVIEVDRITLNNDFDLNGMYAQGMALLKSRLKFVNNEWFDSGEGFQYWFDSDDIQRLENHNEQFKFKNFEEELLIKHFRPPFDDEFKDEARKKLIEYMSATDIANYLADKNQRINVNNVVIANVGKALKKNGFIKKCRSLNGKNIPLWAVWRVIDPASTEVNEVNINNFNSEDII